MQWLKKLWKRIRQWWKKRQKKHKPRKVTDVITRIDMAKNVTVAWALPTTRTGGAPLPLTEIRHTAVALSADGGSSFVDLPVVLPTATQQAFVPDLEVGEWIFRMTVIDTNGSPSAGHVEGVVVIDDSPPNDITDVVVTQE